MASHWSVPRNRRLPGKDSPSRTAWCTRSGLAAQHGTHLAARLGDGGGLLEEVRLFDIYTGEQVAAGHKSLAYRLRFRAPDRTLTDEETTAARDAAVAEAGREVGAVLRGES